MQRRSRASPVIKTASFTCDVLPNERCDSDPSAPAGLWPPAGQQVNSAIIGHVTLADVEGRPGAWRWVLTNPHQLAKPVTGVHGHPGLWLTDLPPRLSTGGNAPS